jgi:hypothetical protein
MICVCVCVFWDWVIDNESLLVIDDINQKWKWVGLFVLYGFDCTILHIYSINIMDLRHMWKQYALLLDLN